MIDLIAKAAEIQGAATLPLGWGVRVDRKTGNIIVHNAAVGFFITPTLLGEEDFDNLIQDINAAVNSITGKGHSALFNMQSIDNF